MATKMHVCCTMHLDGNLRMDTVRMSFVFETDKAGKALFDEVDAMAIKGMEGLGFKRYQYGHIHHTVYA